MEAQMAHPVRLDREAVFAAVGRARVAQPSWAATRFRERGALFRHLNHLIGRHLDDIAALISEENGKPSVEALVTEILPCLCLNRYLIKNGARLLRPSHIRMPLWSCAGKSSYLTRKPVGVVGIITPWNYPWGIPSGQIATALMAGNTVVLKPSSVVPRISAMLGELFADAGFPSGVLEIVNGPGPLGEVLIEASVDHLVFTGSVEVGRRLHHLAAEQTLPVTLELGGKDAALVLDDADLDVAAAGVAWGAFANAGQTCASIERVFVDSTVFDTFITKVLEATRQVKIGPLTTVEQFDRVLEQVNRAVENGARVLSGGPPSKGTPGRVFPPTVLVDVNPDMEIMREETFGPVLPLMPVRGDAEAVCLANDSRYGLSASIWTSNLRRGKHLAEQLEVGTVTINDALWTFGAAETPWGGVKDSGLGRTHGAMGLLELTTPLHVAVDIHPHLRKLWWFPYTERRRRIAYHALQLLSR